MDRYAFLLISMSLQEAKAILGFPPNVEPSPQEISKAWKTQAFANHPDRGGDPKKMVEINVAKDVLEGKQRPTYDRPAPAPYARPAPSPHGYGRPAEPPKPQVTSFDEAKAKAGVPSGVNWLFVTAPQYGKGYSSDEYSRSETYWVAFGLDGDKLIFVAMSHYIKEEFVAGGAATVDIWAMETIKYPKRGSIGQLNLSALVGKALKGLGFDGRFNSKVISAKDWVFSNRFPRGAVESLKSWMATALPVEETQAQEPAPAAGEPDVTWQKLRDGSWGIKSTAPLTPGDKVMVRKKYGTASRVTVGELDYTANGVWVYKVAK